MRKIAVRNAIGLVVLVAGALALAGCGGGSKSSAPAGVTVTVAPSVPATTTTAAPTHATTAVAAAGGSLKDCSGLSDFGQQFSKALAASGGTGGGDLSAQAATFKAFASKAPAEIRDQLQIIADAIAKYAEALKGVDLTAIKAGKAPSPEVIAKMVAASKDFNQPEVTAASQKISAYVQAHCHA